MIRCGSKDPPPERPRRRGSFGHGGTAPLAAPSRGMFIRYYIELNFPSERVARALSSRPSDWIQSLALDADRRGGDLLADIKVGLKGHRLVGKAVRVDLGDVTHLGEKTVLPMSWHATGASGLFPVMEGDLEVAPLGAERTQLAMSARYTPPLGSLGDVADRAILHRVAEATIKDFVDRVGQAIAPIAGAGP